VSIYKTAYVRGQQWMRHMAGAGQGRGRGVAGQGMATSRNS